jgi:hypothetical protein
MVSKWICHGRGHYLVIHRTDRTELLCLKEEGSWDSVVLLSRVLKGLAKDIGEEVPGWPNQTLPLSTVYVPSLKFPILITSCRWGRKYTFIEHLCTLVFGVWWSIPLLIMVG